MLLVSVFFSEISKLFSVTLIPFTRLCALIRLLCLAFKEECGASTIPSLLEDSPAWHRNQRRGRKRARASVQAGRELTSLQKARLDSHHGSSAKSWASSLTSWYSQAVSMGKQAINKGKWKCGGCGYHTLVQFWYCCHCSASRQTSDALFTDKQK